MDENWYSAEQEIRDRMSEARAAARVRALVHELATPRPRRDSVWATLKRWTTWIVDAPHRGGATKSATSRLDGLVRGRRGPRPAAGRRIAEGPTLHPSERRTP